MIRTGTIERHAQGVGVVVVLETLTGDSLLGDDVSETEKRLCNRIRTTDLDTW